eukprot:gnl/TRDRNA2_/TRDRNA2_140019_c3_seq1.p1 gnl/TRDRNA2_/TRDRNA2_140019_c3~~gnl/TRDRNA2_/TRDRNA2_140019_c3_seq1.p1  ORF type:complete len:712 (+),score=128.47 gnl/TRDRNA2_/TRDRNA2_140019_c3_seq1:194-2137(+)
MSRPDTQESSDAQTRQPAGDEGPEAGIDLSDEGESARSQEKPLRDSPARESGVADEGGKDGQREEANEQEEATGDANPNEEETDEDHLPDEEKAQRQWERYRARNRSLIVDVFEGQLRSRLTCCQCGASSSTFEPFRYLSVPIPSNHSDRATLRVVFFPLPSVRGEDTPQLRRYSVCVPKSASVHTVEKSLGRLLPVPMSSVLLAEVYRSRIHRYLDSCLPLSDVRAEDQLFAFEVLQTPSELTAYQERFSPQRQRREKQESPQKQPALRVLLIQAMHRRVVDVCRSDGRTWAQRREVYGLPFVMSAVSSWSYSMLHEMLLLHSSRFLKDRDLPSQRSGPDGQPQMQAPFVVRIVNASGTACGACDRRNCTGCLLPKGSARLRLRAGVLTGSVSTAKIYLALDWVDFNLYDQSYVDSVSDDNSVEQADQQLDSECYEQEEAYDQWSTERSEATADGSSRPRNASGRSSSGKVPMSACIDAFSQTEELLASKGNGVRCEKCNQVVDAVKRLEIWREPDVLIIHIKRFHFSGVHYEKLNTPVEVPINGLSLRSWIVGPSAPLAASQGFSSCYDLFAVACHWGGMSGGHYTSFCYNEAGKEPTWLKFNDDVVTSVSLAQEIEDISRQCYVLYYKKRALSSSNLINYSTLA